MTSDILPTRVRSALAGLDRTPVGRHVEEVLRLHAELSELRADRGTIAEVVRASLETAACGLVALVHDAGNAREEVLREALGMARAAVVAAGMAVVEADDERRRGDGDAQPSER